MTCESNIEVLRVLKKEHWGPGFVNLRIDFARHWCDGLIFSTIHGTNFFENILACLDGKPWDEKGEYGQNFRELIRRYR